MEFGLDVRPSLSRPTGVGTYVLGLLDRLPALAPNDRFTYFSASFRERYPPRAWLPNARMVDRRIPVRGLTAAWNRLGWPPIDRLVDRTLDLVHSPTPLLIPAKRAKRVVTIHDLFFLKHPDLVEGETRRDFVSLVRDHVKRADGVICVSEYTAAEARRLLDVPDDKIAVTPHGVDPIFRETPAPAEVDQTLRRLRLPRGGILYVGSAEKRKNLVTLVMAYMTLARRKKLQLPPLVLAGPGSDWAQGGSYVGPQIVATGYLERGDVRALMAASSTLVLPSLEEGFGLPVVEAMAAGLPVVCSRGSALAEVAGDAASLVDPYDVNGLAHAIERMLEDRAQAAELRARGLERSRAYEWTHTAERTLAFYRKVLGR
ncbi:MAG TPA: glycosyltransferase family 1 protein [Vicinamibacteria bacterium]|jgi:glycosyltransferase involved in cell wall biosynthesis